MKALVSLFLLSACVATATTEEKLSKTFAASPGGTLVVEVGFGSIEIIASPARSDVSVDVSRKISRWNTSDEESFIKENPVEFTQEDNTVTIRAQTKTRFSWSWFGSWRNSNKAHYVVQVPEQFNARVKTAGGSITVSNITGSLKAGTSGGSLHFTNIHGQIDGNTSGGGIKVVDCENEIRVNTSGGSITATGGGGMLHCNTSGGSIAVKNFNGGIAVGTSGGGITVENIQGQIRGNTSGGSIHALLVSPLTNDIDLSTSGGSVTLRAPENAAFQLDAKTSGGGVSCELPLTVQGSIQRNHMTGIVNGGGPKVHLRSSGGSINVRKL